MLYEVSCNCGWKGNIEVENQSTELNCKDIKDGANLGDMMISKGLELNNRVIKFECGNEQCKCINEITYGELLLSRVNK
ncbi:hypothetical protein N2W42_001347 [Clostridium perfringens]|uniref:hypothetical protein n=1 Tax=Clostridium perfringens TaxID=1502 RepID=UPI002AC678DA|nr:hypothetical protein [Clostridium perfringens]MDZ4994391.1 hypothetical protein [Clostridium perfringens]